ncbi:MAG: HNH endonuclease, partial [Microbacterium sp.]
MRNFAGALGGLGDAFEEVLEAGFAVDGLRGCGDDELVTVLAAAGRLQRGVEAVMAEAVALVLEREDLHAHPDRLTTRHGCRNVGELVQRATRVSGRTASEVIATASAVGRRTALSSGELLPAEFPCLREALRAGQVGIDGVLGVLGAFRGRVIGRVALLAADEELAAAACGEGADAAPPACADDLRGFAQVWAAYLDQDGAEPAQARALRRRGITLGRRGDDGLVPVRGHLLPELAAQLQLGFDSVLNPRVDPVPGPCFTEQAPDRCEPVDA